MNAASERLRDREPLPGPIWWRTSDARAFVEVSFNPGQPLRSIEIQVMEKAGVTGLLVLLGRPTGELDLLFSPGLDYDEEWFRTNPFTAHMKFGSISEARFRVARCEVTPTEVDAEIDVDNAAGARIQMRVAHRYASASAPWFVPATPQEHPFTLRFMQASSLRMLPKTVNILEAKIGGETLQPRPFLLPPWLALYYDARVGSGLVGAGLNASGAWPLSDGAMRRFPAHAASSDGGNAFQIAFDRGSPQARTGDFKVRSPVGTVAHGRWQESDGDAGPTFTLAEVRQNWFPGWDHPLRILMYLIRRIRRRNENWRWVAKVEDGSRLIGEWHTR